MDTDTKRWLDEVYRQRVLEARATPPEEGAFAGFRIFDQECQLAREGIRSRHPDASDEQVQQILADWLELTNDLR